MKKRTMTMIPKQLLYSKLSSTGQHGNKNLSPIYTILNNSGPTPVIEYSSCSLAYYSLQMTERHTYEQKTTYRRPPTRRNASCPT